MNGTGKCSIDSCPDAAVTCFAQQEFCLHHLISRCYEDLNRFDVRASGSDVSDCEPTALKAFVEESSRCVLEVSLQCQNLDNLQRGRILDILLWAGDLLSKTSAIVRSTRDALCATGTRRESFTNFAQRSVGCVIVRTGGSSVKDTCG